jgi:hypothetical protein
MALSPSFTAALPAFRNEQAKRPVLNGRPHHNYGLSIGLFHPVFNVFHTAMAEPFYGDQKTYNLVRGFCKASADIYTC